MLPSIMHAMECRGFGGPEIFHWAEKPVPVFAPDEVLIRVTAAGMNRADLLQRQGKYPPPQGASDIIGMEVSGTIAAIGSNVQRWKIGDQVCALLAGGGYAEYVAVPETHCLPVPSNISLPDAAALPEAIITVWANVFEAGALQPGETLLIHGGSSGIGTTAIQMAKALGAKVFVTVGSDEKAAACRALGVDLAINYKMDDFVDAITRHIEGQGVNVILDMVGGEYVARNLSILAPRGRHVSIAVQAGRKAEIDIRDIMQKRLIVTGSTLRGRDKHEKGRLVQAVEATIWPKIVSGSIKPLIYKRLPIKNAAEAHKMMESGEHIGKIILEVAV